MRRRSSALVNSVGAWNDAATVWPLDRREELLTPCVRIRAALGERGTSGETDKSGKPGVGR